jgi:hypothetical protein
VLRALCAKDTGHPIEALAVLGWLIRDAAERADDIDQMRYRKLTPSAVGRTLGVLASRGLVWREWTAWSASWHYLPTQDGHDFCGEVAA